MVICTYSLRVLSDSEGLVQFQKAKIRSMSACPRRKGVVVEYRLKRVLSRDGVLEKLGLFTSEDVKNHWYQMRARWNPSKSFDVVSLSPLYKTSHIYEEAGTLPSTVRSV